MVVLEDAGNGGRHEGLAQANHVADQHAVAFVEVVGGDLDRCDLKIEELLAEVAGNAKLGQAEAGLLGKMVGHFQVDVVGRNAAARVPNFLG